MISAASERYGLTAESTERYSKRPGRRDAQRGGAVLEAPVGEDRRPEARVPEPAVRVDGRGRDRRSARRGARGCRRSPRGRSGSACCWSSVSGMNAFSSPRQSEMLWWQPLAETPMNGFGMKHGKAPSSRPTCLQTWRNVERLSAVFSARSKLKFSSIWPGRVLVVALDHVEPERLPVLDHLVDDRLQLAELVDVVAVRLRDALMSGVPSSFSFSHIISGSVPARRCSPVACSNSRLDPLQVAAAVGGEEASRGSRAPRGCGSRCTRRARPCDPRAAPRRCRAPGMPDELGRLGAVADVVAVPVGEEVRGRAVDELEALRGHALPVRRRARPCP